MRLSVDTGGTFTDLVLEDDAGVLEVHKRPTTPDDPVRGILDVLDAAAAARGIERRALLARADTVVHATTHALNALLTGRTARTALLTTAGHRDVLVLREGGREHFNARAAFPQPYVPRALTFELRERVASTGAVVEPLDEAATRATLRSVAAAGPEAVAVCLLWSIVEPAHEQAVGRLLEAELPGVPYTLSHRLAPSVREYRRASATAIDASLKPLMGPYLSGLARRLAESGFAGRLLMVTSAGTLLDVDEVAAAPIHAIKSGPAMAPVAGRRHAERELGRSTAIVTDTGGTSYDVALVRAGTIPWTRETWLGERYLGHLTGFPSVDVRSYGAGGGSIARVDEGGLLWVGPQSAGADPGPVAYGRGGREPTFTDAAVVLGHLDPADFLGGRLRLDADAARRAVAEQVAAPLGLSVEEAAAAVVEVMTETMVRAIEDATVRQGVDPTAAALVAGGGAAGLNAVGVAARLGCPAVLVPDVSAVLSAAGALLSDLGKDFAATLVTRTSAFDHAGVASVLTTLRGRADAFLAEVAVPGAITAVEVFAEAHYAREVWEIEVPVALPLDGPDDVERFRQAFHRRHAELYAVSDEGADIEVIAWRLRAVCEAGGAGRSAWRDAGRAGGRRSTRRAWFAEWLDVPSYTLDALRPGEQIAGPALVTSPVSTTVLDPGSVATVTPSRALRIAVSDRARAAPDSLTPTPKV